MSIPPTRFFARREPGSSLYSRGMSRSEEFGAGHGGPVYHGEGLAGYGQDYNWSKHALTERPHEERKHEPGYSYGKDVAMVPTSQIARFREYNRGGSQGFSNSKENIEGIKKDLEIGGPKAMKEPIWVDYDHEHKWGYVSEGNHRIEAAIQAGVSHVPVRMIRGSGVERRKKSGIGAPLHLDNRIVENTGYMPGQLHPGNFQEFEGNR